MTSSLSQILRDHTPLSFSQFAETDYQDLTKSLDVSPPISDVTHCYYIRYLCIIGDRDRLRRHLDFALVELNGDLCSVINNTGDEGFINQTAIDTARQYHPTGDLVSLLKSYGGITDRDVTDYGGGVVACTHDTSDSAYILFSPEVPDTIPFSL